MRDEAIEIFDYIVIGAGTAGCIVAERLSRDPGNRVLVLEAGGNDNWIWFHIPVGYLFAINNERADWCFQTDSEPGLNGRSLVYPRGKVVGGSSSINAMIAMRGQAADYNHWHSLGLAGWAWNDVLPWFRKLEDHFLGESDIHGVGGGWRVEPPRVRWNVLDAVAEAAQDMGIPSTADFNTGNNEGVGYFHVNQKRGRRWSAARGFLKPALKRSNLCLKTDALVQRLSFEGKRVAGLEYRVGDRIVRAKANAEVILCAGSVGSVQILQRSGLGPAAKLAALGIDVAADIPGIGENLQDHLQQRAIYKIQGARTLNETYHSLPRRGLMGLEYLLLRRGPLTMAPSQLGIFTRTDKSLDRPDVQFHVQPLSLDRFGEPLHRFPAITISGCNLRPTSRGTVYLHSSAPDAKPGISCNYLSTDHDQQVAAQIIRLTREMMRQPSLQRLAPEEYLPGTSVDDSIEALVVAAGNIGTTIFHPVGTAKMGTDDDPMSVLDERLRVRAVDGLRVVDASVMPTITSGNTNTPTAMIGMKGAEMIREDHAS